MPGGEQPRDDVGLLRGLALLDRGLEAAESTVLAGSVMLMAAVSIANVIGRNLLGNSLVWAPEVNQILMILITFLGIGYGVRHARHIRMSAIYDQVRGLPRKAMLVVMHLGTGLLMVLLAWYAWGYAEQTRQIGATTPALGIPQYLINMWVPIGFLIGGIQYLLAVVRNLTAPGTHLSFQQPEAYEEPGSE